MSGRERHTELAEGLAAVERRISDACERAGRDRDEVRLIVVTKFFPADDVRRLVDLGVRDIGENKDQEASAKVAELPGEVRELLTVHFVGQLQSNKAGHVARYADVVHSLDRPKIVRALQRGATNAGRQLDVLLQLDLAGDDAGRGGADPATLQPVLDAIAESDALRLRGVMAVAPRGADPAEAFARLRRYADQVRAEVPGADWISAGMSGDLEQAIACGATHLRVGSAILGSRPTHR